MYFRQRVHVYAYIVTTEVYGLVLWPMLKIPDSERSVKNGCKRRQVLQVSRLAYEQSC